MKITSAVGVRQWYVNERLNKTMHVYIFLSLYQAAVTVEISILLICFCSFDLFCPLLEKGMLYRKFVYCVVLSH